MKTKLTTYKVHRILEGPALNDFGEYSALVLAETSEFMGLIKVHINCTEKEGLTEMQMHLDSKIEPYVVEIEEPDDYYIYPH